MTHRRWVLAAAIVLVGLVAPSWTGPVLAQGCGGPSAQPRPPEIGPRERWRIVDDDAGSLGITLVTNDVVVVTGNPRGCVASVQSLRGIDPATGEELWSGLGELPGRITATPVGIGDAIYLAGTETDAAGASIAWLAALAAATGERRWHLVEKGEDARSFSVGGGNGDLTLVARGSNDGSAVIGLNAATGETHWTAEFQRLVQRATLDPASRLVYAVEGNANEPNDVVALDAATGEETWRFTAPTAGSAYILSVLDAGVIIAADNRYWMLAAADGTSVWDAAAATGYVTTDDAFLTISTREAGATVVAIGLADGAEQWAVDLTGTTVNPWTGMVAGDRLVLGTSTDPRNGSDGLLALDLTSGEEAWRVTLPSAVTFDVGDEALYVTASFAGRGRVSALSASDGEALWSLDFPDLVNLRIAAVFDEVIYVSASPATGAALVAVSV